MNDLFNGLNPSALFAGGIFAAVIAGWNQVKSFLNYLQRFLVVEVRMEPRVASIVYEEMRTEWKRIPHGLFRVFDNTLLMTSGAKRPVPFIMHEPFKFILYYRGKQFAFFHAGDHVLRFFRGCFDVDAVMKSAYLRRYDLLSVKERSVRASRFVTRQKFGPVSEYSRQAMFAHRNASSGDEIAPKESSDDSSFKVCDHRLETPVFHSRSEFKDESKDDPLHGRYFPENQRVILEDAATWMRSESWYAERALPWRRGWLSFGPPGTGKSTLAEYTARYLGVPLYVWHLKTYDDPSFHQDWAAMERPCVALFDDFDAVFEGRKPTDPSTQLTFDCLLNTLSGPGELSNGVLTVFTTNNPASIDDALARPFPGAPEAQMITRPGRIDRVLELGFISLDQAIEVMRIVTRDDEESLQEAIDRLKSNSSLDNLTPILALDAARYVVQSKLVPTTKENS